MNADLRLRCAAEIKRRLFPHTALTIKQLCYATGRSRTAVDAWLAGTASIKVEDLAEIARFLNDRSFLPDVFDLEKIAAPASDPLADIKRAMREVLAERQPQHLWITADPTIQDAPAGHAEYVRQHLGLPVGMEGDHRAYALRNMGWAAITLSGNDAELAYHASGIKSDIAGKAASWLRASVGHVSSVKRTVLLKDGAAEAEGLSPERVADELDIVVRPVPQRITVRKSLDAISDARLGHIFAAWRNSPSDALNAAGAVGLIDRTSMFDVDASGNVSCNWLGAGLDVPRDIIRQNVLAWRDPLYGSELRRDLIAARDEGVTYAELHIPVFGQPLRFRRLAAHIANINSVITVTQRMEALAA